MATVVSENGRYVRVVDEVLGEGGRTCRATVTANATNVDAVITKASTINISTPTNLTEAELAAYTAFVATLDEIAQELEDLLYVEEGP